MTGFFPSYDASNCVACHPFCLSCSGPKPEDCTACYPGAKLSGLSPTSCECEEGLDPGPDVASCTAISCHIECKTCEGEGGTECTSCYRNAYLLGVSPNECVCKTGYYPNPNASNCEPCLSSCVTCVGGSPGDCLSCTTNAMLET
jgi:proprotein convertase subtilisin/kexin type 5